MYVANKMEIYNKIYSIVFRFCNNILNFVYYCLVSEVEWIFDDLCRPPDIRILHESSMVICSRRHYTLWGTHTRRHSRWVGPGSSVIMLQIRVNTLQRSYWKQDKVTLHHATFYINSMKSYSVTTVKRVRNEINRKFFQMFPSSIRGT